jgi:hypothetical protein
MQMMNRKKVITIGGSPSKGTPKDKRLAANKPKPAKPMIKTVIKPKAPPAKKGK